MVSGDSSRHPENPGDFLRFITIFIIVIEKIQLLLQSILGWLWRAGPHFHQSDLRRRGFILPLPFKLSKILILILMLVLTIVLVSATVIIILHGLNMVLSRATLITFTALTFNEDHNDNDVRDDDDNAD